MFEQTPLLQRLLLRLFILIIIGCISAASPVSPLLAQETKARVVLQIGHSDAVSSVAISPDGRIALSGSRDKTIKLWDVATGREMKTFAGHSGDVNSVAFSPDGRTALSGSDDKTVKLWDVGTGHELKTFIGHSWPVHSVAFSPDGRIALSGCLDGTLKLWDIASGREIRTLREDNNDVVTSVAFSPDGHTVISASWGKTIKLWNIETGSLIRTFIGHSAEVRSVAFSPDGRTAVSGSDDKTVKVWDVSSGRLLRTFTGHSEKVESVAVSPDGRTMLSGSGDGIIRLWDIANGHELGTFTGHSNVVESIVFSSDGRTALSGSADDSIKLWDVPNRRELRTFTGYSDQLRSVTVSPDGRTALATVSENDDDAAKLWDITSGRILRTYTGASDPIAFAPDGRTVLSGGENAIKLWDVASGQEIRTFPKSPSYITSFAFSPDGRTALSALGDNTVKLWNVANAREIKIFDGYSDAVNAMAFSPNGRTALFGGDDSKVRLWDIENQRVLRTFRGHFLSVDSVAFSPDGLTALSGGFDKVVRLWDINSGRELRTFIGHSSDVKSVTFSSNGETVLSASRDNTAKLWDTKSGREIRTLAGHSGEVNSAFFVANDQAVLTGSNDGSIRLWDTATGSERATMVSFKDGSWLTITPEGFFDASSPQAARNLNIVRGLEVSSVDQVYNALYRPDLVREKLAGDPTEKVKAAAAQLDLDKVMASGMAPKVAITSPASDSSSPTDEVAVEAMVADQGGGIGKVEWRVNGVTLGLESRGLERVEGASVAAGSVRTQSVKRTLSLEPGDNRIEVVAYNAKGLIASEPAQVIIKWDGSKTASPPKLYVLAVGVNDYYDSRLHLAYAVPDATALAEGFRKAGSGLYALVEVKTVLDSDVTVANLDKVFAELGQKVQPRDVFVFFLAGHGKTENGRYYFLPRDFRYEDETSIQKAGMGQDKFQAWFAEIPARKSILLYDTCESGSLTGATRGSDIDERLGALNRMARATGRTFLTATTDDAPALEGYHGHGVFTYALLDALDHADVNKNGLIEVSELADYIDQKVPDYSFEAFKLRQVPQRSVVGNNFALTNKAEVLPATPIAGGSASIIPTDPTHVVVAPVDVKTGANDMSGTVTHLSAGTQIRLVDTVNGWALIARNGQKLGYVQKSAVAGLQ